MAMVVRNNMSAVNTLNTLNRNSTELTNSLAKVSSGMRINSAADDASAYAISERMRVQIRSLDQDDRNTQNGISLLKVAEGAVSSTVEILKTLKEKVINAATDTNTDADRATIQKELDQSIDQINDNANITFNGKYLVDGSKNGKGGGTFTALTNSSMSTDTQKGTALTDLKNRNGENLNINLGDQVIVSYVQGGKTYSTDFKVTAAECLGSIFSKAEAIAEGDTFANVTNKSIVAVNGESDSASLIAAKEAALNSAKDARDAAQTAVNEAQAAVNGAVAARDAFAPAKAGLKSKFEAFTSYFDSNYDKLTGFFVSADLTSAHNKFDTWVSTGASAADYLKPCANPAGVSGSAFTNILDKDYDEDPDYATRDGYTEGKKIQSLFNAYKDAYDDFIDAYPSQAAVDALDSAVTSGNETLTAKKATLALKQQAVDTAQREYDSIGGPEILTGKKIGLDYYGNILESPTGESVLTITSAASGIAGQISGFTISVSDKNGNIKKSVNAVLDNWVETIRAENVCEKDNALVIHTGTKANQSVKIALTDMRSEALGLKGTDGSTLNISTQKNANAAINVLDNALQKALDQQTTIGAIQSRLDYTSRNLVTASENVRASESTIRDADMAKEMTEYTKNNVLLQASQSMLAQANQNSSNVLSLLQ